MVPSFARRAALGVAAAATIVLAPHVCRASADDFGVGDGHTGDQSVMMSGAQINSYTRLAADAAVGATTLTIDIVSGPAFGSGDLVLVWSAGGLTPAPASGDPSTLALTAAGRWELARLSMVVGNVLTMSAPLVNAFPSAGTQIIRVPEYRNFSIAGTGSIVAPQWDGQTGGIVAFLATGAVDFGNGAQIDVDGDGFRGGALANTSASDTRGCTASDGAPADGFAAKGEGVAPAGFGATVGGRGNVGNGAGGGDCMNSGGGGGGNGTAGGQGGRTYSNDGTVCAEPLEDGARDVGGLGGAPMTFSSFDHLAFGGGGGAGDENSGSGSGGAAGGGVVLIRAGSMTGAASIHANGFAAGDAADDGAGGGGAAGTIVIRLAGAGACSSIAAIGGDGGNNIVDVGYGPHGPGGGGGAGRVLFQSTGGTCPITVRSGAAGTQDSACTSGSDDANHGATPATPVVSGPDSPPVGGYCFDDSQCPSATPICDDNGFCRGCARDSECATDTGTTACAGSGPNIGQCVQCTQTDRDGCAATTPVCTSTNTCVACNGNNGASVTDPCPTTGAPDCVFTGGNTGACIFCSGNGDCAGNPAGTTCNRITGACGPACGGAGDCPGGACDQDAGQCVPVDGGAGADGGDAGGGGDGAAGGDAGDASSGDASGGADAEADAAADGGRSGDDAGDDAGSNADAGNRGDGAAGGGDAASADAGRGAGDDSGPGGDDGGADAGVGSDGGASGDGGVSGAGGGLADATTDASGELGLDVADSGDDGACGCRTAGGDRGAHTPAALVALGLGALAALLRRRRGREREPARARSTRRR